MRLDDYCKNFNRIEPEAFLKPRVEVGKLVNFKEMEKEQYRSVIRFLFLEGKSRSEIKERLDAVNGDSSPLMATVKNWFNEFQHGRISVFDESRPGAPKTARMEENIKKIHALVLGDRRFKVREVADTVGLSKDRVGYILHE
ncbi:protein GVQW3-like, partial [Drosophila bipectinata]|uniref:protein GVQW3-like n=1 Tax=Drosophila bipectinata TaxID=42026 RepID=UPI0038B2F92D